MVPRNDERQAVEAEYAQRLQVGPDFTQCQVGSGFEEAPLHRLDAADKRQVLAAFDAVREWQFRNPARRTDRA
jgi:hypothetical protein